MTENYQDLIIPSQNNILLIWQEKLHIIRKISHSSTSFLPRFQFGSIEWSNILILLSAEIRSFYIIKAHTSASNRLQLRSTYKLKFSLK